MGLEHGDENGEEAHSKAFRNGEEYYDGSQAVPYRRQAPASQLGGPGSIQ